MSQRITKTSVRVGIIGSRNWQNHKKVKDTIYNLKQKFGESLIIISGGCPNGADAMAKKYALEFDCFYREYNPSHTNKNLYSAMNEGFYGKVYTPKNFFHRNKLLARGVDYLIAFIPEDDESNGTIHTIKEAKKCIDVKKIIVIS
jgi:predicted Rossmann fold nucleotide-binding protein DprA/Smf involved in DNA uptake